MREKTKLEQILARQRQKLDEVYNYIQKRTNFHLSFLFRLIMFVQYPILKVHIRMNLNLFIIEFVNRRKTNDYFFFFAFDIHFFFMCFMFLKKFHFFVSLFFFR